MGMNEPIMNMLCEQAISAIFKILTPYLRRPVDVACRLVRADLDRHSARGPSRHAATDAMPDCENIPCGTRENRPMGDLPGVRGRGSIPAQHVPRHGQQTPVTPAMHALARMA